MTEKQFLEIGRLFDTQEKWDAFLELCYKKDPLRRHWFHETIDSLEGLFLRHPGHDGWNLIRGDFWIRLSPSATGQDSLSINIDFWNRKSCVWINANLHDSGTVARLLEENSSSLLPVLPGFVSSSHPWEPMVKTISFLKESPRIRSLGDNIVPVPLAISRSSRTINLHLI